MPLALALALGAAMPSPRAVLPLIARRAGMSLAAMPSPRAVLP